MTPKHSKKWYSLYRLKKPIFFFHVYKELRSWALLVSITTANASIQVGPIWCSVAFAEV